MATKIVWLATVSTRANGTKKAAFWGMTAANKWATDARKLARKLAPDETPDFSVEAVVVLD